jgi:hypothetical protein
MLEDKVEEVMEFIREKLYSDTTVPIDENIEALRAVIFEVQDLISGLEE